jgi:AcrR family transcriptional regulator
MKRDAVARASSEDEREKLIGAMIEVAGVRGLADTTVAMVVAKAGLGRSAFDRHFDGLDDCFLESWQELRTRYRTQIDRAYEAEPTWRGGLRQVLDVTLRCIDEEPERARILCVEVLQAGERGRKRRDELLAELAALVDRGRDESDDAAGVAATTAQGIVGGIYNRIYESLRRGAANELEDLGPELMAFAVTPYLGVEAGREELERAG